MDNELKEDIEVCLILTNRKIADAEKKMKEAIKNEDWSYASYLEAYINGMKQIEEIFRQAVG